MLVVFERWPAVEKTVDFVCKAVTELAFQAAKASSEKASNKEEGDASYDVEEMHPLLLQFFESLLKVTCISFIKLNTNKKNIVD